MENEIDRLLEAAYDILSRDKGLTSYECMDIAAKTIGNHIAAERNKIMVKAFASDTGGGPPALEAIAMQLGMKPEGHFGSTLIEAIQSLKD